MKINNKLKSKSGKEVPPRPTLDDKIKRAGIEACFKELNSATFGIERGDTKSIEKFISDYSSHYYGYCDGYEMAKDLERDGWPCDRDWIDELECIGNYIDQALRKAVEGWVNEHQPEPPYPVGTFISEGLITDIDEVGSARFRVAVKGEAPNTRRLVDFENAELDEEKQKEMEAFVARYTNAQQNMTEDNCRDFFRLAFIIDCDIVKTLANVVLDGELGLVARPEFYKEVVRSLAKASVTITSDVTPWVTQLQFNCQVNGVSFNPYIRCDDQFFDEVEVKALLEWLPYEALSRVMKSHCEYLSDFKMQPTPIHDAVCRLIERNKTAKSKEVSA
ncbi:hypothetical protein [Vibrio sonorensis]|uniref:hypothetical protein n=1 Tax=Vibrio sonorensis TaxID=1004316 RepID=UPI0008DABAC5|nr:hypothetical protein [Vibrio sonorensis]